MVYLDVNASDKENGPVYWPIFCPQRSNYQTQVERSV